VSHSTDLRSLTLAGIARRCTHETERFFQRRSYDPWFCFELFRRAILERDSHAWERVYAQYHALVTGWVVRHQAFPASGEEAQFFVNRAFEKMWAALVPGKFGNFPNLQSLLRYLQMCVHSTILDQVRSADQSILDARVEDLVTGSGDTGPIAEGSVADRVHRREFWEQIEARLNDEKERRVVYGSFVLGLKPRQLLASYPEAFDDVKEIYRIKENVLARLRRDRELEKILGPDA
jgi:DNA-directed RNA polymerase specialized sigma24 family protein